MSIEQIGQKPAYSVYEECDTYRELCGELLAHLNESVPFIIDQEDHYRHGALSERLALIKKSITKAEAILGEE